MPYTCGHLAARIKMKGQLMVTLHTNHGDITLTLNGAPADWVPALRELGHSVVTAAAFDSAFGHAHAIAVTPHGTFAAAADPRARIGSAAGI